LKITLAGSPFVIEPDEALSPREREALERLAAASASTASGDVAPFRLGLVDRLPWPGQTLEDFAAPGPAAVEAAQDQLHLTHRRYAAALDPVTWTGRLFRPDPQSAALEVTLRVALSARLPSLGVLPLHAAGLVIDGAGHAFFGPSGAGKSTLSGLAPGPVISDELVAVAVDPPELRSTGFWGEMDSPDATPSQAPLGALVELARGTTFRLERIDATTALRRLLGVLLVPPLPALWSEAMALAGQLCRRVPVYRMEWTPEKPPWAGLREALFNR
jgi:hypothetical protein